MSGASQMSSMPVVKARAETRVEERDANALRFERMLQRVYVCGICTCMSCEMHMRVS